MGERDVWVLVLQVGLLPWARAGLQIAQGRGDIHMQRWADKNSIAGGDEVGRSRCRVGCGIRTRACAHGRERLGGAGAKPRLRYRRCGLRCKPSWHEKDRRQRKQPQKENYYSTASLPNET